MFSGNIYTFSVPACTMKIGLISDIHENIGLLSDSLKLASIYRCDEIACLGDITGYDRRFYDYDSKRSASQCLRLIKSTCKWVTLGNHDLFAARIFPTYSNGFRYPADWFSLPPETRKRLSAGMVWCFEGDEPNDLQDEDLEYLRSLPESIIIEEPGIRCLLAHYLAPDYTGSTTVYFERGNQLISHWKLLENHGIIYSFGGHSHNHMTGFAYRSEGRLRKAFNSFHSDIFNLGKEMTAVLLLPVSGEKGRRGFSVLDTDNYTLKIYTTV